MVNRNPNLVKLKAGYLFPEVNKRKLAYLAEHPDAKLISLGIGDTTEPISPYIADVMSRYAHNLSTPEGYSGYGPEQGHPLLREKIANHFYKDRHTADEIFISDGSKCDIGRLQVCFGNQATIAVQNPAYPVYVDTSLITGQPPITFLNCNTENHFFPDLKKTPRTDLVYFCSPNNPTGAAAEADQLLELVQFCRKNRSILIFDSAYSYYIKDPFIPKSIYEIEGSDEVAIELGSFSKMAGFTGVRLSWTVIPDKLVFEDGTPVKKDWSRINSTFFNGASNIAQAGGIAVLEPEGLKAIDQMVSFYLENARLLRETLLAHEFEVFGGDNAPYLWVRLPNKSINSWDAFQYLLDHFQIVTTPGIGFGSEGEGFIRFSAFSRRENILEACSRLSKEGAIRS